MIKILIVDDELIVRVGLKSMIDWNAYGFHIIGEASDGEEALNKIHSLHPQIVLTDLKMPKMDGIELLQKILTENINVKVVVLSCHNEFELVKSAMKLGAKDYILKLSMKKEELIEVILNIKDMILEEDSCSQTTFKSLSESDLTTEEIKSKLFKKIIYKSYFNPSEVYQEAKEFGLEFHDGHYLVLVTKINHVENQHKVAKLDSDLLSFAIANILDEIINKTLCGDVFIYREDFLISIITYSKDIDKYNIIANSVNEVISDMQEALHNYLNISVSTGICEEIIDSIESICRAFETATITCDHKFYYNESTILFSRRVLYSAEQSDYFNSSFQNIIYDRLKLGDIEAANRQIQSIFEQIAKNQNLSPNKVKIIAKQISNIFSETLHQIYFKNSMEESFELDTYNMEFELIDSLTGIETWLQNIIQEYTNDYNKISAGNYSKEILKLKQFINQNHKNSISLDQAASILNLGKNYFCSIFKKETGETFNDYIVNVRIEKAKELLKISDLKNYEIAAMVGYDNFNYFSTLFKKVVGMSPSDYKKSKTSSSNLA